ncbi:3505_t:CDS:10 [Funneliformis caledonium]|uniref:Queuosine 5'-phosphate N-glycosylase/hydrolase n=1 Tax=Funneliformis caledonium TaxID=1117310 RepID=A0A9N9HR72_9GLOM|nr:3505_t:CDS:10 [Funneliformis caledonium]
MDNDTIDSIINESESQHFVNPVLESAYFINKNAKDVTIPRNSIQEAANAIYSNMKKMKYSVSVWKQHELHPKIANEDAINWIFLADLLNFSFWSDLEKDKGSNCQERFTILYKDKRYTGYWSLCAAINRAIDEGIPITTPSVYASAENLNDDKIKYAFRSHTGEEIPLLQERINCMREAGKILVEKFDGSFINCIKQSNNSAMKLLKIITDNFECFRDECEFLGRKVQLYKRAQILIADTWACFEGQVYGSFNDIDEITMFADYRVPQALHHLGALSYSQHLLNMINSFTLLPNGSQLEIEIRELLKRIIQRKIQQENNRELIPIVNTIILDFYIWDFANEHKHTIKIGIHRTRSIFY